ncbi:MAG: entericidin A/B family lipoprotein [Burkholderiales bacterium]|nr:entericidin A/B family lipoprotein [Burkholderiales bacterium]
MPVKRLVSVVVALAFGMSLAACNTVAGAGKDIEKAGEKIQGAAKK